MLNYSLTKRLSLIAGPQFGILISARFIVNGIDSNITHNVEEREVGILVGLEYAITYSFFLSARYLQGLNHVGIRQGSDTKEFVYQLANLTAVFGSDLHKSQIEGSTKDPDIPNKQIGESLGTLEIF